MRGGPAGLDAEAARKLVAAGRPAEAAGGLIERLAAGGGNAADAAMLGRLLNRFAVEPAPLLDRALRAVAAIPDIDLQPFARALAASVLASAAWRRAVAEGAPAAPALLEGLLPPLLARCINRSLALERGLLALRRSVLAAATPNDPELDEMALLLARQAANIEYAWPETDDEAEALASLAPRASRPDASVRDVLCWSMYRSPVALPALAATPRHDLLVRLVAAACPSDEERGLRATIPRLAPATDATSRLVQAQYEANPYPRWLAPAPPEPGERRAALVRRLLPTEARRFGDAIDVLIAGCGTGRQAIDAWHGYGAPRTMLAIDLSAASLGYAALMARRHGCAAIEFLQADLLDLGQLERRFDVIEAIGVLHHLREPMAGWRRLCERLKPGGVMRIALYSERARRDVVAARAQIAALGLQPDIDGIRRLRRLALDATSDARDWRTSLPRFGDFFSASGCRDLVFHVEEHRFTPAGVAGALVELGLDFLGFEIAAPVLANFLQRHPGQRAALDLARWEAYEAANPGIFAGMMTFWCRRPT